MKIKDYSKIDVEKKELTIDTVDYTLPRYKKNNKDEYMPSDDEEVVVVSPDTSEGKGETVSTKGTIYSNYGIMDSLADRGDFSTEQSLKRYNIHTATNLNKVSTSKDNDSTGGSSARPLSFYVDVNEPSDEEIEAQAKLEGNVLVRNKLGSNLKRDDLGHGVISSNMGRQDKEAMMEKMNWNKDAGSSLGYDLLDASLSLVNVGNVLGVADDLSTIFSGKSLAEHAGMVSTPSTPSFDERIYKVAELKDEQSKNVPITNYKESAYYNNLQNSNNTANKLLRGDLTKDASSFKGMWDSIKGRFTNNDEGWVDTDEDIFNLNLATEENMYSSKPGHTALAKDKVPNTINNEKFFDMDPKAVRDTIIGEDSSKEISIVKSEAQARAINILKNKNTFNKEVGFIYVSPFYSEATSSGVKFENFDIPFEFKPQISEGAINAKYQSEALLGRINSMQVYTGTEISPLTLTTEYIALSPDDERYNDKGFQDSVNAWEYLWTDKKLEEIELKYRSLVFPVVNNTNYLIKPPIIQIKFSADDLGSLYKYPNTNLSEYFKVSKEDRYKKYVVTSVNIDEIEGSPYTVPSAYITKPIDSNGISYEYEVNDKRNFSRRGFKVTLQCIEVMENFLDITPDYASYYNAWKSISNDSSGRENKLKLNITDEDLKNTLTATKETLANNLLTSEEAVKKALSTAYLIGSFYLFPENIKDLYDTYLTATSIAFNDRLYLLKNCADFPYLASEDTFSKDLIKDFRKEISDLSFSNNKLEKPKYADRKDSEKELITNRIFIKEDKIYVSSVISEVDHRTQFSGSLEKLEITDLRENFILFPDIHASSFGITYDEETYSKSQVIKNEKIIDEIWVSNEGSEIIFRKAATGVANKEINEISLCVMHRKREAIENYRFFKSDKTINKKNIYFTTKRKEYLNSAKIEKSDLNVLANKEAGLGDDKYKSYDNFGLAFTGEFPYKVGEKSVIGGLSNPDLTTYFDNYVNQLKILSEYKNFVSKELNNLSKDTENKIDKDNYKKLSNIGKLLDKLFKSMCEGGGVNYLKDNKWINSSFFEFPGLNKLFNVFDNSLKLFLSSINSLKTKISEYNISSTTVSEYKVPELSLSLNYKEFVENLNKENTSTSILTVQSCNNLKNLSENKEFESFLELLEQIKFIEDAEKYKSSIVRKKRNYTTVEIQIVSYATMDKFYAIAKEEEEVIIANITDYLKYYANETIQNYEKTTYALEHNGFNVSIFSNTFDKENLEKSYNTIMSRGVEKGSKSGESSTLAVSEGSSGGSTPEGGAAPLNGEGKNNAPYHNTIDQFKTTLYNEKSKKLNYSEEKFVAFEFNGGEDNKLGTILNNNPLYNFYPVPDVELEDGSVLSKVKEMNNVEDMKNNVEDSMEELEEEDDD